MPAKQRNKVRIGDKTDAIVLVRLSALGDVAMTIPAVYDLCYANPDTMVVMVTRKWMAAMMVNAPRNLQVMGVDLNDYKGVGGMWRLARRLRSQYNIVSFIDLHDVLRTRMLRTFMRWSGVPVSVIDKGRKEKKQLVEQGAVRYAAKGGKPLPTTSERYCDAIVRAGYDLPHRFTSLRSDRKANENDRAATFRIGVAPFAAHPGKVYPLTQMREVVDRLAALPGVEIYLFGAGADESAVLTQWAANRSNVVNMAERKAGLAAELELMSSLDVMIGMDSGNMHMAAIAGATNVIGIWGATHPAAGFTPHRCDADNIVQLDLECRPCSVYGNRPCRYGDLRCMTGITPQTIVDKVTRILNNRN